MITMLVCGEVFYSFNTTAFQDTSLLVLFPLEIYH